MTNDVSRPRHPLGVNFSRAYRSNKVESNRLDIYLSYLVECKQDIRPRWPTRCAALSARLWPSVEISSPWQMTLWLLKPGTHWRQSWIQYGRLYWKSTVAETGNKSATKSTVADTVDFVASVYGAKATRSTLSTFNKVDRVEFNFVSNVYRA